MYAASAGTIVEWATSSMALQAHYVCTYMDVVLCVGIYPSWNPAASIKLPLVGLRRRAM
jgi:hypothetical protein